MCIGFYDKEEYIFPCVYRFAYLQLSSDFWLDASLGEYSNIKETGGVPNAFCW